MKQTVIFDENHGSPAFLDVCRDFLGCVTSNGFVRIFKVAGREAKPHAGPGEAGIACVRVRGVLLSGTFVVLKGSGMGVTSTRNATVGKRGPRQCTVCFGLGMKGGVGRV